MSIFSNDSPSIIQRLSWQAQLGINIMVARRYLSDPPMTQTQLAKKIGRSQRWLSQVESGDVPISAKDLREIAIALKVSYEELQPPYSSAARL